MAQHFRTATPVRSCAKKYKHYLSYKPHLADDFHHKCGYTDCSEIWFGGQRTFQIDHFKPESKYPELVNDYNNLVYCCSYVNRAKWDDDRPNYLDPCDEDYNVHFERDDDGYIIGKTAQGRYMVEHMELNLARYAIIWKLDRLKEKIDKLKEVVSPTKETQNQLDKFREEFYDYTQYLADNL